MQASQCGILWYIHDLLYVHSGPTESPDEVGLRHEGCYHVLGVQGLFLFDGRVNTLRDNPFQRVQAVEKCAKAASTFSYSVIGVAAGYCISGNNKLSAYTRYPSTGCRDGRGAYITEYRAFYMDVYTITDPTALNDAPPTQSDSTTVVTSEQLPASAGQIPQTFTLTVCIAIVGAIMILF